jgi:hypothetical protein
VSAAGRRAAADGIEFLQHDITETPFPVGPADFLYARLLVAHLAAPAEAVGGWLTQLAPGGRMALDEVEWIRTDEPVLKEYVEIALPSSRSTAATCTRARASRRCPWRG